MRVDPEADVLDGGDILPFFRRLTTQQGATVDSRVHDKFTGQRFKRIFQTSQIYPSFTKYAVVVS